MTTIIESIKKEILSWPYVTSEPHRFGGIEFRLNKKELGHIHGDRLADLPFPMSIRNDLVNSGRVSPHHVLPKSGWVSYWIRDEADIDAVIELFRLRYEQLKSKILVQPNEKNVDIDFKETKMDGKISWKQQDSNNNTIIVVEYEMSIVF